MRTSTRPRETASGTSERGTGSRPRPRRRWKGTRDELWSCEEITRAFTGRLVTVPAARRSACSSIRRASRGDGEDRIREAYGDEHYGRLKALKRVYDPANVFRNNQNISPD